VHTSASAIGLATGRRAAIKSMAIKAVDLADPGALRERPICVRDFKATAAAVCAGARRAYGAGVVPQEDASSRNDTKPEHISLMVFTGGCGTFTTR